MSQDRNNSLAAALLTFSAIGAEMVMAGAVTVAVKSSQTHEGILPIPAAGLEAVISGTRSEAQDELTRAIQEAAGNGVAAMGFVRPSAPDATEHEIVLLTTIHDADVGA